MQPEVGVCLVSQVPLLSLLKRAANGAKRAPAICFLAKSLRGRQNQVLLVRKALENSAASEGPSFAVDASRSDCHPVGLTVC